MSDGDRLQGPFAASEETDAEGRPIGVEVGGDGRHPDPPMRAASDPVDETGTLDDEGETRREEPRDIRDREDLRSTEDRIDDRDSW
jgi:hypothetical protein